MGMFGASDGSTAGTCFGSGASGNAWGGSDYADLFPVNGVTFQGLLPRTRLRMLVENRFMLDRGRYGWLRPG